MAVPAALLFTFDPERAFFVASVSVGQRVASVCSSISPVYQADGCQLLGTDLLTLAEQYLVSVRSLLSLAVDLLFRRRFAVLPVCPGSPLSVTTQVTTEENRARQGSTSFLRGEILEDFSVLPRPCNSFIEIVTYYTIHPLNNEMALVY